MIDILFKMTWLKELVHSLVDRLNIADPRISESLTFFIYDVIKIFLLLGVAVWIISYIQSYFPVERVKEKLKNVNGIIGYFISALFGTITPFCSCSSIPLFIGFTRAGLPIGYTFSFLISSPLVDLASIILISSFFGVRVAFWYVVVGILLAMVGGFLIDRRDWTNQIESFVFGEDSNSVVLKKETTVKERIDFSTDSTKEIFARVWKYVIIGVLIGALIHNWIPTSIVQSILGQNNFLAVPLAVLFGIPVYADTFGTLPIAESLLFHGVGLGTILAFMMAVTTMSLPSIILLRKIVKNKLLMFFIGYVTIGIIVIGYLFNILL